MQGKDHVARHISDCWIRMRGNIIQDQELVDCCCHATWMLLACLAAMAFKATVKAGSTALPKYSNVLTTSWMCLICILSKEGGIICGHPLDVGPILHGGRLVGDMVRVGEWGVLILGECVLDVCGH